MGLLWTGWIKLPLPALSFRAKRVTGSWGAFALGVPFSVAICPVCMPALLALLGVVALKPLPRYQRAFDVVSGVVLVLAGLYMLNAYFFVVPPELAG